MIEKRIRFRLVTYNIHMGLSPFRKRDVLSALDNALRATNADILCLQEDVQTDDISESEMAQRCSSLFNQSVFFKTVVHPKGVQGNTIISRFPIQDYHTVALPGLGGQERGLLHAVIRLAPGILIDVFCIHLGLTKRQRFGQANAAVSAIRSLAKDGRPWFLAGDFNDWRRVTVPQISAALNMDIVANSVAKPFRTFPAWLPILTLDHILYRACDLLQAEICAHIPKIGLSDHLPITADFGL